MKIVIQKYLKGFWGLFFPNICSGCDNLLMQQEEGVCIECLYMMPKINYIHEENNPIAQIFWGRVEVKHIFALYFYETGGTFRRIIHNLKYKNDIIAGKILGKQLAYKIKEKEDFNPDFIVPVPLHIKKFKKRGYNQCDFIAKGMQEILNFEINNTNLIRTKYTDTQTELHKFERWNNVADCFEIKDKKLFEDKHILLVDDIITTGATLEACIATLHQCRDCSVSIACLGKAD